MKLKLCRKSFADSFLWIEADPKSAILGLYVTSLIFFFSPWYGLYMAWGQRSKRKRLKVAPSSVVERIDVPLCRRVTYHADCLDALYRLTCAGMHTTQPANTLHLYEL